MEETKEFHKFLKVAISIAKGDWASGQLTQLDRTLEYVAVKNISCVEKVKTIQSLIDLDYEDYKMIMSEEENAE